MNEREADQLEKHPDAPGPASVEDELTPTTRESFENLGRADLDESPDAELKEGDDIDSPPGQNSDWMPQ